MGTLLHYTDLTCVKIKTADGKFSWKFKIPACEHFSTWFGVFYAEDWICISIFSGTRVGSASALSLLHSDAKEKHTDIHLLLSSLPLCSIDCRMHSHYFKLLSFSVSEPNHTQTRAHMYCLQSSVFKSQINEFWWMTKEWNLNSLFYFPSQFFRKFLFITSS